METDPKQLDDLIPHIGGEDTEAATEAEGEPVEPPCEFITGIAGSGKTFEVKRRAREDPHWGVICATTGIAAVNLETVTLHSTIGFFDTDSLEDLYAHGRLQRKLAELAKTYRNLVIDECSMLDSRALDILYQGLSEANSRSDVKKPMGLILTGDFCQLPPVKADWCFNATCWPSFEANTTRLQENWRQGDGRFLDALNLLRSGKGMEASEILKDICEFNQRSSPIFDGTIIVGKNLDVDRYNWIRYSQIRSPERSFRSVRWGKESGGWKNIPDSLRLKVGTYVMILANDTDRDADDDTPRFRWVNGDCGTVVDLGENTGLNVVTVKLERNGTEVSIGMIERRHEQRHTPDEFTDEEIDNARKYPESSMLSDGSFWDPKKKRWVRGSIVYMPLRHAYATTVHKSQGLTLDKVQVDLRNQFVGMPAMTYVALSRCRSAEGLKLVGTPEMLARRCNIDEAVRRWL